MSPIKQLVPVLALLVLLTAACGRSVDVAVDLPTPSPTSPTTTTPSPGVDEPTVEPTPEPDPALGDLEAARARWDAAGIADYAFTTNRSCECLDEWWGPIRVHVVDGIVVSATWFREPSEAGPGTVDDVFDAIETSIDNGEQVDVTYDPETGFPMQVKLDLESIPVDGGLDMELSGFISYGDLRAELEAARAVWDGAEIDDYVMEYALTCFCPRTVTTVTVRNGEITDTVYDSEVEGNPSDPATDPEPLQVDDLFDMIEHALDSAPVSLDVTYAEGTGVPLSFYVDEDESIADEEYGVEVIDFEIG